VKSPRATASNAAFTLLELSLVLGVLSLLIAGILSVVTQNTRRAAMMEVSRKMDVIEAALLNFRRLNGRLPCPADGSYAITSQYFGIEGATTGTCTGGTPAANFTDGSNTIGGVVPIKTLGLSNDYAFDPWNGRFFYAVDKRITGASAFTTYTVTSTSIGSMSIYDGSSTPTAISGTARTTVAIAMVMSFGPNGHGAYQFSGVRKSSGSNNIDELQNCHCDNTATATAFDYKFVQHPPTTTSSSDPTYNFDDIVRYYLRSSFLNTTDTTISR